MKGAILGICIGIVAAFFLSPYFSVKAGLHSKNASPETKRELAKLIDFANGFHRADECGKIKWEEEK